LIEKHGEVLAAKRVMIVVTEMACVLAYFLIPAPVRLFSGAILNHRDGKLAL
jgi:hypothetical protein